ncbi:hypothetical protein [Salipiger mangrovisoli]|uniref:Uncharacterized protein n=1 Tax=Salipiger mangrovisoli TaxID=2865933 RepID=A0ABR9XAT0_9RHOB|nr:hypothetical protein [Salipiger mangrovisoli]MBE9640720.1 hypothetical protein [Salipiger mangrovisoli]
MMYAVTANSMLRAGTRAACLPLTIDSAQTSLRLEPGCHHFDVCDGATDTAVSEVVQSRAGRCDAQVRR